MGGLIFVCGMPRSGTTWLGKIFDSHPETLYLHEPDSAYRIEGVPILADTADVERYRVGVERFIDALPSRRLTKIACSLPIFRKSYYNAFQFAMARAGSVAAKSISRVLGEVNVPAIVDFRKARGLRLVWKSIESVGAMGVIMRVAADARGILILRHPCGYIASVLRGESRGKFEERGAAAEDFGAFELLARTPRAVERELTLEAFRSMAPVERLAWRWVLYNEKAIGDIADLPSCTQVLYENVCRDPVVEAQRLFVFAGLDWNPQTDDFIARSTASEHSAYYSIFKDPLKAANKWRRELAPRDVDTVMAVIGQSPLGRHYLE